MESGYHKILEIMEDDKIPEGTYLKIANVLKSMRDTTRLVVDISESIDVLIFTNGILSGSEYLRNPYTGRIIKAKGRVARSVIKRVLTDYDHV